MSRFLFLLLMSLCFINVGFAKGSLWHGVDDKNGKTAFYLYLDGEQSKLYTPSWNEQSALTIRSRNLEFKLPYKSYGINFIGQRKDEKFVGTWKIHQVQYVTEGTWTAQKVFTATDWQPWSFLEFEGAALDMPKKALEKRVENFDSFRSFWVREFEPAYFALFSQSLYCDQAGDFRSVEREKKIKEIFELLQSGKDLSGRNQKFMDSIPKAQAPLEEKYPSIKNVKIVATFSGGDFDYRPVRIDGDYYLLMGAEFFLSLKSEAEMVRLLAEGLMYSYLSAVTPMPANGRAELVRRSLADYLLADSGSEVLSGPKVELKIELEKAKNFVRECFKLSSRDFVQSHLLGENRGIAYRVFQEFGKYLATGKSPDDLTRLNLQEAAPSLKSFFGISD